MSDYYPTSIDSSGVSFQFYTLVDRDREASLEKTKQVVKQQGGYYRIKRTDSFLVLYTYFPPDPDDDIPFGPGSKVEELASLEEYNTEVWSE